MRPLYHYTAAANWLSDPNGLVWDEGQWHLFYQYNPHGEDWGHMSWGHAVSPDLAKWHELPVAIEDDAAELIFSGSAVVDSRGIAGFGQGAMLAFYTSHAVNAPDRQSQALAVSTDCGHTFARYDLNPLIDRGLADFRDPNVFFHGPSQRWVMVVALSAENRALVYGSHNLIDWHELSAIDGADAPGQVWECPLLVELPVEGSGQRRWMFKVDVLHGGPGSGAIYQTGTFDGVRFVPDGQPGEAWQVADWGRDFYAAIAWHEPRDNQDRPAWIGWMGNHAYQGRLPAKGWRGAMSVPRRLSLLQSAERWTLRQEMEPAAIAAVPAFLPRDGMMPRAGYFEIPVAAAGRLTISDDSGRTLAIERDAAALTVSRTDPGQTFLDTQQRVVLAGNLPLQVWFDTGSVEILAHDGTMALTFQHLLAGESWFMKCEGTAPAQAKPAAMA